MNPCTFHDDRHSNIKKKKSWYTVYCKSESIPLCFSVIDFHEILKPLGMSSAKGKESWFIVVS